MIVLCCVVKCMNVMKAKEVSQDCRKKRLCSVCLSYDHLIQKCKFMYIIMQVCVKGRVVYRINGKDDRVQKKRLM